MRWRIIKLTGWTFDQVDSLSAGDLHDIINIEDAITKAKK